jgi:hypothetical protein
MANVIKKIWYTSHILNIYLIKILYYRNLMYLVYDLLTYNIHK